jgi:hypothetical protein
MLRPPVEVPPEPPVAPEPVSAESGPGEFTGLFGGLGETDDVAEPQPEPPPVEKEPGEFTRLFGKLVTDDEGGELPRSPKTEPAQPQEREPSEFTRPKAERQSAADPGRRKPPIRWRESAPQDEPDSKLSVRWKAGPPVEPPPVPPDPRQAPLQPPPGEKTVGEFTKLFNPQAEDPAGPLSPASPAPPGPKEPREQDTRSYQQALGSGPSIEQGPSAPPPPPPPLPPSVVPPTSAPAAPPPSSMHDGPSEYTLIVSGGTPSPDSSGGSGADPYAEYEYHSPPAPQMRTLLISLGVVVAVVIFLIIAFAIWGS